MKIIKHTVGKKRMGLGGVSITDMKQLVLCLFEKLQKKEKRF